MLTFMHHRILGEYSYTDMRIKDKEKKRLMF